MARAGFTSRVIIGILKKWNVEDEVLTALEQEREELAAKPAPEE